MSSEIDIKALQAERDGLAELEPVGVVDEADDGLFVDIETPDGVRVRRGDKLYARPVPAEPVNARLLEALKGLMALSDHRVDLRDQAKAARSAIAEAEAQQERLLQDMHDAGREIDRVMAEAAPKAVRLTEASQEICYGKSAEALGTPEDQDRVATEQDYAPPVRLTHADIAKALASAGLMPEDYREDGEILPLVIAIESAALRKNGIEVAE